MRKPIFLTLMMLFIIHSVCLNAAPDKGRKFEVRDDKPASRWEHAYPVGNGRLGAMPFGDYPEEQILLNEETIWLGRGYEQNSMESMYIINDIRNLLWQGKYKEAQSMTLHDFLAKEIQPRGSQPLGFLKLAYLTSETSSVKEYRRILSMNKAVASNEFKTNDGYHIRQEVFASHPDNVIVVHIRSLNGKRLSVKVEMDRKAGAVIRTIGDDVIVLSGQAKNENPDSGSNNEKRSKYLNKGVCFHGVTKVLSDGHVYAEDNSIKVNNANDLLLLVASATDYNHRNPYIPLKKDREKECLNTISSAEKAGYARLLERHTADHKAYFERATVDLGSTDKAILKKTTPERIKMVKKGGEDPDLIEDLYQMGRYMLIASSRKGTLPPNLTGIWNGNLKPHCVEDWHTNINVQENYWHAEATNLSDLHEPFITLIDDIRQDQGKQMASKLGCRGFVLSHATHAWKESIFSGHPFWGMWPMGGAWCCSHVMEHYRFTGDTEYLRNTAYPILKDNVLFCLDWLTENPETGELVSGPSTSPENGFYVNDSKEVINVCMGPAIDQQIIYESFTDFLEASKVLGISDELTKEVLNARDRLAKTKIAPDGRIMEWDKNYREWEINHRHYSHLYALYPGCEITPETHDLFEAARKSIEKRQTNGGCPHGWSRAWLVNLYARLFEPEKAYSTVLYLLSSCTLPNLMHREKMVFFDGNGAGTAGITEMLLQSQGPENIIRLLPALPKEWNKGSFYGLCARGAFEIDLEWINGKPKKACILSKAGNLFHLKCDNKLKVRCNGGEVTTSYKDGVMTFDTVKGGKYTLHFTN